MRTGIGQGAQRRCVIERTEEGVGQRDHVHVAGVRVRRNGGVDPECDWELHLLPGAERLPVEAEASRLVEILADFFRGDVVEGDASDWRGREVARLIESDRLVAELEAHLGLLGVEIPRQARVDVGIEPDRDHRCGLPGHRHSPGRRRASDDRCAGIAGDGAEHPVQRHRGERGADHACDHAGQDNAENRIAAGHWCDIFTSVIA